jgi:hypothetical protein
LRDAEGFGFFVVEVLAGVGGFVLEGFDEAVEAHGEQRAQAGPDPVDVVRVGEAVENDFGAEGAGGVEGAAGEGDAWIGLLAWWLRWLRGNGDLASD